MNPSPDNMKDAATADEGRTPRRVGLLAGWGRYPFVIAQSLKRQGVDVYCLGVSGHTEPGLDEICDDFEWIGLCKIGRAIRYFKRHGITEVAMLGKIHKVALFQPWRWLKHLPDWKTIRIFAPHFLTRRKDCRDDTLLVALVEAFAAEGIHFGPPTDYAPGPNGAIINTWHIDEDGGFLHIYVPNDPTPRDRKVIFIQLTSDKGALLGSPVSSPSGTISYPKPAIKHGPTSWYTYTAQIDIPFNPPEAPTARPRSAREPRSTTW